MGPKDDQRFTNTFVGRGVPKLPSVWGYFSAVHTAGLLSKPAIFPVPLWTTRRDMRAGFTIVPTVGDTAKSIWRKVS